MTTKFTSYLQCAKYRGPRTHSVFCTVLITRPKLPSSNWTCGVYSSNFSGTLRSVLTLYFSS